MVAMQPTSTFRSSNPVSKRPQHGVARWISRVPARPTAAYSSANDDISAGSIRRMRSNQLPTLSSLSAVIDIESKVTQFEVLAGRTAMMGVAVAASVELVTQEGIFRHLSLDYINGVAVLAVTLVSVAAGLAVTSKKRYGISLREAVITSLTASRRSAGSITQAPVDKAVDQLFDTVIADSMPYLTIPDDDHI